MIKINELLIANGQLVADTLRHLADNEIDSDYFAVTSECESYGTEVDFEFVITDYARQAAATVDQLVAALQAEERERDELRAGRDTLQRAVDNLDAERDVLRAELARRDAAALEPVAVVDIQRGRGDGKKFALCYTSAGHSLPDDVYNLYTAPPAASVLDGWKLVPIKPTWGMLSADGCSKHHNGQECSHHENRKRIWSAMLAAAPAQGGDGE